MRCPHGDSIYLLWESDWELPQSHHPHQQPAPTTAYLEIEAWLLQESWARSGYYSRDIICNRKGEKEPGEGGRKRGRGGEGGREGGTDKRSREGRNARGKGEGG